MPTLTWTFRGKIPAQGHSGSISDQRRLEWLGLAKCSVPQYSSAQRVAGCERCPRCVVWPIAAFPFARQGALLPTWQAPLTCSLHAAVSHFQTMLHCQRRPRQPPTAHSRVRPRNLTLSPPLPLRSLTVAPLQTLQRCDGETTER